MVNTDYGRDLLCIPKHYGQIINFSKRHVSFRVDAKTKISDFRVGAKWGNIIRLRFKELTEYAGYYEKDWRCILKGFFALPPTFAPGLTISTFYPDPDPETNTVDGWVLDNTGNQTWAVKRAAAGDSFGDSGAFNNTPLLQRNGADDYSNLWRSVFLFDTDAIGTDSISAATLSLYGSDFAATLGGNITIVLSNPASNTALATADYEITAHWTMTQQNTTDIAISSWVNAYNDFALNATGIGNINKTGITKFGAVTSWDRTNTAPGAGVGYDYVGCQFAETTGTSQDPKLVVTHAAPAVGMNLMGLLGIA